MHGHQRSERMAAQLQRLLAVLIRDEVRDPRAAGATVTTTQVSRDLSRAKIFILAENPDASEAAAQALNHAAGFLRSRVAAELTSRGVPHLTFLYDRTVDHANHMERLISEARARDRFAGHGQEEAGDRADASGASGSAEDHGDDTEGST